MTATSDLYRSYLDLRWHFDPASATSAGVKGHDDRLGDFSADRMREHMVAFKSIASAVEQLEVEDTDEEIDRTAFLDEVRIRIARFEREKPHVHDPGYWLSHLYRAVHSLLKDREKTPVDRARGLLGRLKATPAFLKSARETVQDPPRVFLDTATELADAGPRLMADAVVAIRESDPSLATMAEDALGEAETALNRFAMALRGEFRASHDDLSFAIGEDQFNRRLHHEHALRAGAPELYRYGLHLVDEVSKEVEGLSRQLNPTAGWRSVVEKLRSQAAADGDLLGQFRGSVDRARAFLQQHDLVTIPEGRLDVIETPHFLRPLMPFAAYTPPAVFGEDPVGVFYVTTPAASAPTSHSHFEIGPVAVHEAWPGHHLQMLTARRASSEIRRVSWTPVTVEGWALYCEELMNDHGFFRSVEERLFQRLHLLWRAMRIVLDIGLHTRGMTPDQAVDLLVDKVAMDRARARAEVSRYCAWPTYQLCYAVGRRELLHLRDAWRTAVGPSVPIRQFHDAVLGYGGLPVSLIRWGMGLGIDE